MDQNRASYNSSYKDIELIAEIWKKKWLSLNKNPMNKNPIDACHILRH